MKNWSTEKYMLFCPSNIINTWSVKKKDKKNHLLYLYPCTPIAAPDISTVNILVFMFPVLLFFYKINYKLFFLLGNLCSHFI